MNDWKLYYLAEEHRKTTNMIYQFTITGLFLFDNDLGMIQPKVEYYIGSNRVDIYYEKLKTVIEIDENYHKDQKEQDSIREKALKKAIPGLSIWRVDIEAKNLHQQVLLIKADLLSKVNSTITWDESDCVDAFNHVTVIDYADIGEQVIAVVNHLFGEYAAVANRRKHPGSYLNVGANTPGNYYAAVVCYPASFNASQGEVSFMCFSDKICKNNTNAAILKKAGWSLTNRIPNQNFLEQSLLIKSAYTSKSKEDQYQELKAFILKNYAEVKDLDAKLPV